MSRPSWVIALEHEFFRLLGRRKHTTPRGQMIERRVCRWYGRPGADYADCPTYMMCPGPPDNRARRRGTFEGDLARPENQ